MDARQELEQLRKLKRLRELEAKAGQRLSESPAIQNAEQRVATNPTSTMSTWGRDGLFAAGMGQALNELALGAKQRLVEVAKYSGDEFGATQIGDPSMNIQDEIDERRRLDAPLLATQGGSAGRVAGNIGVALPLSFIPGANTYGGAALTGALMGNLQPTAEGESAAMNTAQGATFGITGKAMADVLSAALRSGWQGTKALFAPFSEAGREKIAANTLRAFAAKPDDVALRLAQADEIIPGSVPTAADIAQDAGISQLQRSVQAADPQIADDFAQRALDRNAARIEALKGVTKYGDDIESAIARRGEIGQKVYKKALGQKIRVDDKIKTLTERPSFQQALERARKIASDEGAPIKNLFDQEGKFASTRALHYVKMGYDDLINAAPQSGIGKAELNAIRKARGELLDWISENNPAYKTAMARFEKASRPINQQEIVDALLSRATRSQVPNVRGEMTIYPSSYGQAIKDKGANLVQTTLGRYNETLDDVMRPEQMAVIRDVLKDAAQESAGVNFGRAVGSNTAQNLAGMNILRQTSGPLGFPGLQGWAERNVFPTGARMLNLVYGGQEPLIKQTLAEILMDPQRASALMSQIPPQQKYLFASELLRALPAATGTAVAVQ